MKNIKFKSLIIIMLLTLLITCIPSNGFAEDNLDKNIQKIKALFEIGDDYEDFDKHEYDSYEGKKITSLYWRGQNRHINVGIDEEGNIMSYSKGESSSDRQPSIYKFPKITREQGVESAKNFIKKLYPNILDKIKLVDEEDLYTAYRRDDLSGYNYNFIMIENDIVFNENTVYITVDNQTSEVINFNINWRDDLEFPDTEGIISTDEVKETYKDNINIGLSYIVREADKDTKSYLGYNIIDTDKTVDAKTKDMLNTSYKSMYSVYGSTSDQNMESLSNEEANQLINSKKVISREEISKKILDTFKLGEDYEIQDHKLKGNKEKDSYVWEVMVIKRVKNGASGVSGRIDAVTGEILDFSDPGSWDDDLEEAKYRKEELLERAEEIIKNNSPEKYKEVEYVGDENEDLVYSRNNVSNFLFIRKVNGIRVENDGFRIILNNVTGKVSSYYHGWNDLEFESPDNLIQEDEAKEIILKDRELELGYQTLKEEKDKKDVKLVYDFKDKHIVVDAKTGEVIDIRKELMEKQGKKEYKDIENSFAKEQIQKLQNHITLFEGENFKPKQEITQKEFLQLLAQTKDVYSYQDINYLYERFIREGILSQEEKDINATITREEAIKYIIRAFGQEPLDNIGDVYKLEYEDANDISDNLKGHIAIAKGLGLISGEGNFRPKDNLTREEAAVIIYNILNRGI
ncbi:S-layer homology domain-containing protein [Tissierella sp. Yu-01]|uniref:S-layer homology domain-containing protein n=1 Tax=Tissierella sp. Yu-01 TaxID=3035694 RepID=UPI00240E5483|nr:S-layer homology domain-containing protein [Tissierella sp. Yu-01]WFA09038.1 S-layer homology domain-containing protein [Tissierella sp. Yu-01]